jgi:hypothetical protein
MDAELDLAEMRVGRAELAQRAEGSLTDLAVNVHAARPVVLARQRVVLCRRRPGDPVLGAEALESRAVRRHAEIAGVVHAEGGAEDRDLGYPQPGHGHHRCHNHPQDDDQQAT